jgi:hypothetical protein
MYYLLALQVFTSFFLQPSEINDIFKFVKQFILIFSLEIYDVAYTL